MEQHVVPRRRTPTAAGWLGHLSTVSACHVLSGAACAEVFARTAAVLPPRVEAVADVVLHLATRACDGREERGPRPGGP